MSRKKPDYASAFGAALDRQLAKRSMRPADLAAALNVSPAYVSRVRSGTVTVSASNATKFAEAIGANAEGYNALLNAAATASGFVVEHTCPNCGHKFQDA